MAGTKSAWRSAVTTFAVVLASAGLASSHVPSAMASSAVVLKPAYELVGADGGVFAEGGARFSGSLGSQHIAHKIVAVLGSDTNGKLGAAGYLLVDSAGIVYPFGLRSYGDLRGVHLRSPIVAAIHNPYYLGYVMVAADGGMFAFGGTPFPGSLAGLKLPAPIVGVAHAEAFVSLASDGYWLVDAAGHVYTLGGAKPLGDLSKTRLNAPVVGVAELRGAPPNGDGYDLATADGKVFSFGPAPTYGDVSNLHLRAPIVGITSDDGNSGDMHGYYLFAADGGVFAFGQARFMGSMVGHALHEPIAAMGIQLVPGGVVSLVPGTPLPPHP